MVKDKIILVLNKNLILYFLFVTLLIGDFGYSFFQYQANQLDGDIAGGVVPAEQVRPILKDPFGIQVIHLHKKYPNPNRFFSHWFFLQYFRKMPLLLQKFVKPIESIYLASALIKLLTQMSLIALMSKLISRAKLSSIDFVIAALLITPLFQTNGYEGMTIINKSITYSFFYVIPLAALALFLYSLLTFDKEKGFSLITSILLLGLVIVIPFSGPLNTGIVLIIALLLFLYYYKQIKHQDKSNRWKRFFKTIKIVPKSIRLYFAPLSLLCVYSLYLGSLSSPYQLDLEIPSITARYLRLPHGLFELLFTKIGLPLLIISILLNIYLISRDKSRKAIRIYEISKWILAFSLLYILALPLGGYRPYRPNIIRHDTFVPITLALVYLYGISTFHLLKSLQKNKHLFITWVIVFLLIFEFADKPNFSDNNLEKNALTLISQSSDSIVKLNCQCKVLSWEVIREPQESELNSKLLQLWRITKTKKLYYNIERK